MRRSFRADSGRSDGAPGIAVPAPTRSPDTSDLGTSMIPVGRGDEGPRRRGNGHRSSRSHSEHRSESRPLRDALAVAVPAVLLAVLIAVDLVAFLVSPLHVGPLPTELVAVLVAGTAPLTYTAARRLGLTLTGSLSAAAVTAFVLPTASSDVVGAPEHAAVVAGLMAVTLWPYNLSGTVRRYIAGLLGGIAVVASPFAILAIAGAIYWLMRPAEDRPRRARALRGPVTANALAAAVGILLLLILEVPLTDWTWGGSFSLATAIVSLAPALGFAAGIGADAALIAATGPHPLPRLAGVIGGLTLALLIAAAAGATFAQIRDRTVVGEVKSSPSTISPAPVLSGDTKTPR